MPQIERKVLGTASVERTDAPITYYLDGAELGRANPIQYVDITISDRAVRSSLQGSVASLTKPPVANVPIGIANSNPGIGTQGDGPTYYPGLQFIHVTNWFTSEFSLIQLPVAIGLLGSAQLQSLLGPNFPIDMRRLTNNLYQYPDGSLHFLVTVLRPIRKATLNSLGQQAIIWYPYSLTYQVTGYELNDIAQGQQDEQVSCVVQDSVCRELYGYRPGKEEQSDFIETQKQACRVGEAILWQAQMVISGQFSIPYNPAVRRGHTVRLRQLRSDIDILGIVKDVRHELRVGRDADSRNSLAAITQLSLRSTEYVFRSALGEQDPQELLDMRQVS